MDLIASSATMRHSPSGPFSIFGIILIPLLPFSHKKGGYSLALALAFCLASSRSMTLPILLCLIPVPGTVRPGVHVYFFFKFAT